MKKIIGEIGMRIFSWKWNIKINPIPNKSVIICAPHTSNWDFYFTIMGFWALEIPLKIIIKDSHTQAWYGKIVEWMGGIGINRAQSNNMITHATQIINKSQKIAFVITPEGTRNRVDKWKKGFYYIALKAQVPILVGIGDYKNKQCVVETQIDPTNKTYEEVCNIIETIYKPEQAKHPENYNPKIY